jgi:hypothetical protein
MKRILTYYYQLLKTKAIRILIDTSDLNTSRAYLQRHPMIPGKPVLSTGSTNEWIANRIKSGEPFMAGRLGANELSSIKMFDFDFQAKFDKQLYYLSNGAGFFPPTVTAGKQFAQMMLSLIPEADLMAVWQMPFYGYYLKRYASPDVRLAYLADLEPWVQPDTPWSAALQGKKVLVIHPFSKTIEKQYQKREPIFPGTDVLPEFELKTLQAVQTIAGAADDRFATWFDALDWMEQEALKMEFDVAIIGCGAYGFPLAARLKMAGKQAIHLAGATQLLFGIRGSRWDSNPYYRYVQRFFNDFWIHPPATDRPENVAQVENACYW